MKTKITITAIVTVLILACFAFAIVSKSSPVQSGQPPQQTIGTLSGEEQPPVILPHGSLIIVQKSSQKSLEAEKIYTKAQVIAQFGAPDEYSERDADWGDGKNFKCVYGNNKFYFYLEGGLENFILESNDFYIKGLSISIGDEYDNFIATHSSLHMEQTPGYAPGIKALMVWPAGYVDSYLSLYFQESGGKYKLFRIAYFVPV